MLHTGWAHPLSVIFSIWQPSILVELENNLAASGKSHCKNFNFSCLFRLNSKASKYYLTFLNWILLAFFWPYKATLKSAVILLVMMKFQVLNGPGYGGPFAQKLFWVP